MRTRGQSDTSLGKSELCQGTGKMRSLVTTRTNTAPGAPETRPPLPTISRSAVCSAAQSYPARYDPMDWSPPGSSVHGDSPGKNTGVSCHFFLQGIFPTQGSNPGLLHCRQILYHLSHQGSPPSPSRGMQPTPDPRCLPSSPAGMRYV